MENVENIESNDIKKHTSARTTVRVNAGFFPYSCMFFCQRRTTSDEVMDPKNTNEKNALPPTKSHK